MNKKLLITLIIVAVLIVCGGAGYFLFEKSNTKEEPGTSEKNGENELQENTLDEQNSLQNNTSGGVYKSTDGKYTFRLVERSELKPSDEADVGLREASYYAYINNHVIGINNIISDPKGAYEVYKGWFYETAGSNGSVSILVDKRTNTLLVCPDSKPSYEVSDDTFYRFSTGLDGLAGGLSFLNIEAGEFYIRYTYEPSALYTKDWKFLGWIGEPEYDNEGVYVYEQESLSGAKIKYDAKGNKIG